MLEFNNFRMVNLVYVGSPWSQSLKSLNYLHYLHYLESLLDLPGLNDLNVAEVSRFQVHCRTSLLMFTPQVHSPGSLLIFTSWVHVHIDPEVDLHGYHQRFLRRFHPKYLQKLLQKLLQRHQSGFTQRLHPQHHHHFHLWVINIILKGFFKGIIVVSLRVIDGGFRLGMNS